MVKSVVDSIMWWLWFSLARTVRLVRVYWEINGAKCRVTFDENQLEACKAFQTGQQNKHPKIQPQILSCLMVVFWPTQRDFKADTEAWNKIYWTVNDVNWACQFYWGNGLFIDTYIAKNNDFYVLKLLQTHRNQASAVIMSPSLQRDILRKYLRLWIILQWTVNVSNDRTLYPSIFVMNSRIYIRNLQWFSTFSPDLNFGCLFTQVFKICCVVILQIKKLVLLISIAIYVSLLWYGFCKTDLVW